MHALDITGQRFGRWTVLERTKNNAFGALRWRCRCDCGSERVVLGRHLRSGRSQSCGCDETEVSSSPETRQSSMQARYDEQKWHATGRGIEWRFTFETWRAWWETDNRWERRGRGHGKLMMCRYGDQGPYAPGNVYAGTQAENIRAFPVVVRARIRAAVSQSNQERIAAGTHHLLKRKGHPRAKPVMTPKGRFASATLAAEAFGISSRAARYRAEAGRDWRYL